MLISAPSNGLYDARVHGGDKADDGIQILLRHSGFQQPLDASVTSWFASATERDRQTDEQLFALGQPFVRLGSGEIVSEV